jgi:hypothetical protein
MIKRIGTALVLTTAMFAVSGCCGAAKKVKECAEMTKTINEGIQRAKAVPIQASPTPANFAKFGEAYETTGNNVAKLDISTPELKSEQADYVAMTKEVAKGCKDAGASKTVSPVAAAEIQKAASHESAIVDKLNKSCLK